MGVPGLTAKVQKHMHQVPWNSFGECTFLVDAPSLAYNICDSTTKSEVPGCYGVYYEKCRRTVTLLESMCQSVVFYFDGSLPQSKKAIRMSRCRQKCLSLPAPVLAPLLLFEVLSDMGRNPIIVPGEADIAIAALVDVTEKPVILSNDSDFYTYQFKQNHPLVMNLRMCNFESEEPFINCTSTRDVKSVVGRGISNRIPSIKATKPSVIDSDMLKIHELMNDYNTTGLFISYLPAIYEISGYADAWNCGKLYRSYAYRMLNKDVSTVAEYCRVGKQYNQVQLEVFTPDVYDYSEEIDHIVSTSEGCINELVRETCEQEPAKSFKQVVRKYFTSMHEPCTDMVNKYDTKMVQVFAQIQASVYSLHMAQSAGLKTGYKMKVRYLQWNLLARLMA